MFDYKHLQVQVAHPEACVVGPGVRKCVPNLPDTAAGNDNSPSHTQAAMLPQHKLPRCWVPELSLLHSCLLALLIKSKDIIPCSPGKPQHPLVQDLILHGTSLCSAAGTGDSIPSQCWNPSPCNSDKCTSEGELHLVQGSGCRDSSRKVSMSNIIPGDLVRIFPNNVSFWPGSRQSEDLPWKTNQNVFFYSLCISLG